MLLWRPMETGIMMIHWAQMKKRLEEQGFICIGAIAPVIPHIYSPVLGKDRPDEQDRQVLKRFAVEIKKTSGKGKNGRVYFCLGCREILSLSLNR